MTLTAVLSFHISSSRSTSSKLRFSRRTVPDTAAVRRSEYRLPWAVELKEQLVREPLRLAHFFLLAVPRLASNLSTTTEIRR